MLFGMALAPNGKFYAIGGIASSPCCSALGVNEEYDPSTDTWTTKTNMPTARKQLVVATGLNGKIVYDKLAGAR